jgi:pimeloyl-ACP methyl ester carboxylesterase
MSRSPARESLAFGLTGTGSIPVVMLHGLGADRRQPTSLLTDALMAAGNYLIPDLRGHGITRLPHEVQDLTFTRMAQDVEQTLEGIQQAPVVFIGISMGAALTCELLARQRVEVRGAVLIRPAWMWDPSPPNLGVFPVIARLLETMPAAEAKSRFAKTVEFAGVQSVSPSAASALLAQFDDPWARARASRLQALPASAPARPGGIAPHVPAVVIGSGLDPVHPLSLAESLAADLQLSLREVSPRYEAPQSHARQVGQVIERLLRET